LPCNVDAEHHQPDLVFDPGLGDRAIVKSVGEHKRPLAVAPNQRVMDADPIFVGEGDIDAARALVEEADEAELFLYPGDQHYFADSSLPSYDAEASALLMQRVLDFLATR
jgi:dienelactone hydrolase